MSKRNPLAGGFVKITATISVILNLIQNQLDPDFRQDDNFVRAYPEFNSGITATGMILSARWRIKFKKTTLSFKKF